MATANQWETRALLVLNQISEMVAGQTQLAEVFHAIATAAQELTEASLGLFLLLPPAQPAEFYGPREALPLGPPLLEALEKSATPDTRSRPLALTIHASCDAPNSMCALTTTIFHGRTLRGALSALYSEPPADVPMAILTLLNNQARIAMEKWRLENILPGTYTGVIQAIASLIDARDPYAHRHSRAVTELAVALAETLRIDEEQISSIRHAAILHDIGKIGISEEILTKRGPLLPSERALVETHPLVGVSILRNIPYMEEVALLIRHHHEHHDGSGYPDGLRGDEIPLGAQIIAIADVFEAVTTGGRSYHNGLSIAEACAVLREQAGKSLNPELVETFIRMIDQRLGRFEE